MKKILNGDFIRYTLHRLHWEFHTFKDLTFGRGIFGFSLGIHWEYILGQMNSKQIRDEFDDDDSRTLETGISVSIFISRSNIL